MDNITGIARYRGSVIKHGNESIENAIEREILDPKVNDIVLIDGKEFIYDGKNWNDIELPKNDFVRAEAAIASLKWLCFNFPWIDEPKDEADKMCNAIHKYCQDAIDIIEKQNNIIDIMTSNNILSDTNILKELLKEL